MINYNMTRLYLGIALDAKNDGMITRATEVLFPHVACSLWELFVNILDSDNCKIDLLLFL